VTDCTFTGSFFFFFFFLTIEKMGCTAADLTKLWGKFSLSAEESVGVEVEEGAVVEIMTKGKLCLVGKLIANQLLSKDIIKATLRRG